MASEVSKEHCFDCASWIGRCLEGKFSFASNKACGSFSQKLSKKLLEVSQ